MSHDGNGNGLVADLERRMTEEVMMESLETIFLDCPQLTAAERVVTARECNDRRHGILQSLRDVVIDDDESEALLMLPAVFLELRFE